MESQIKQLILKAIEGLGLPEVEFNLEKPADEKFGDVSCNIALRLASQAQGKLDKNPREMAGKIVDELNKNLPEYLSKVEVAGPGFINFYYSDAFLCSVLNLVDEKNQQKNGERTHSKGKVIVEYSSPNIAKPFTVGHLRSTIIGDAIANILEYVGYQVFRDNHLGDWGTQFGKQIYAIKEMDGVDHESEIDQSKRPVKELVELYVKFHQKAEIDSTLEDKGREWFKKLEDGDAEAKRLWQKCIDWSWKEFSAIYQKLGVPSNNKEFENNGRGFGESYFEDKMKPVIEELEKAGLLKEGKGGAKVIEFDGEKYPPLMIVKSDGATLYATRDLATDKFRLEKYGADVRIINEVGGEQELYFKQLFEVEKLLGWVKPGQRVHVKHGLYRFKEGKMSTRKGNVVWLEDVLDEAETKASILAKVEFEYPDESTIVSISNKHSKAAQAHVQNFGKLANLSEVVGFGALKWNDLRGVPVRDIVFDWDEMLNMQGNSGPYVQYTYARARSVLSKAAMQQCSNAAMQQSLNPEERAVLTSLMRFESTVARAAEELAPNLIAAFVYELAGKFNAFYNKHSILGKTSEEIRNPKSEIRNNTEIQSQKSETDFRLALTAQVAEVLKTGLGLLGIEAPERM